MLSKKINEKNLNYYIYKMKKPWIILSIITATVMFIYTMSLVSSQNVCTWVRIYGCVATSDNKVGVVQQAVQQAVAVVNKSVPIKPVKQIVVVKQAVVAKPVQQTVAAVSTQQAAEAKLAAQQQVAASVNTITRAS